MISELDRKDVKATMFSINITKNPKPEGYGSVFYKVAWRIVSPDITEAVLDFLKNGNVQQISATMITLIPKKVNPMSPNQFRLISQCPIQMHIQITM